MELRLSTHLSVETFVKRSEVFIVRSVPRLRWIVDRDDKTGPLAPPPTDPPRYLDVLRYGLGLPHNRDKREAIDIHPDLDNVGGQAGRRQDTYDPLSFVRDIRWREEFPHP